MTSTVALTGFIFIPVSLSVPRCLHDLLIVIVQVFANSLTTLTIGEVFCKSCRPSAACYSKVFGGGIAWGVFQTLTTAYASEVCPIQLRGYLTAYVNLCWGIGILLSSGVVKATLNIESDWSETLARVSFS